MYDLIVVGAGSGGLTAVHFAQRLGAKVALIEKNKIGGDCTWTGCVPSKALIHVANTVQAARHADQFRHAPLDIEVDMGRVKAYVQQKIQAVYRRENPEELTTAGVDIYHGAARFVDPFQLDVEGKPISGKKILLTTGAHPFIPAVAGLSEVPYLTYLEIFDNERLPEHLIVLGGGPVGLELSQAYRRLGARVTIIDIALFPGEESEVAEVMLKVFAREGIECVKGLATAVTFADGTYTVTVGGEEQLTGDMLLVAAGRHPNVAGLELEKAGVAYTGQGITVNSKLQTTASHIYAAGDCTGGRQFTHYAGWQAYKAVRNVLLPGSSEGVSEVVPHVTFTDPEVAQIGLSAAAAAEQMGLKVSSLYRPLAQDDRAHTDDNLDGFIKISHHQDGRIVGATIVAPRAGEMIAELALAMQNGLKLENLAHTIHPYPTYSSGLQMLASQQTMADFQKSTTGKITSWLVKR